MRSRNCWGFGSWFGLKIHEIRSDTPLGVLRIDPFEILGYLKRPSYGSSLSLSHVIGRYSTLSVVTTSRSTLPMKDSVVGLRYATTVTVVGNDSPTRSPLLGDTAPLPDPQ